MTAVVRPSQQTFSEAKDIFAGYPDGVPVRPMWGQPWMLFGGSVGASARPQIVSGKLTEPHAAPAAGYAQLQLAGSCRRIWARFTLGAYTTNNGSATVVAWDHDYATTPATVPNSPCHLSVTPVNAVFGVWSGGSFTQVTSWTFATPLVADGATVHSVEVVIDKANSKAYVTLPDGFTRVVTHALIGSTSATVAGWEMYLPAATDSLAAFTEVGAESVTPDAILEAKGRSLLTPDVPIVVQYAPGSDMSVAVTVSWVAIDAVNLVLPIVAPASGKILMELTGNLAMSGSTRVFWSLKAGATTYGTVEIVNQQFTGNVHYAFLITGLTPTSSYSFQWGHWAVAGSVAVFKLDMPNGRMATMKATPIP